MSERLRVPTDPSDFHHPALADSIGCNHLVCQRCGEAVRISPAGGRAYACSCHSWDEDGIHYMDDPQRDSATDPEFPWRCAGHPEPELPTVLDGEPIDRDLRGLVRRVLSEGPPAGASTSHKGTPVLWVCRLYGHIERHPMASHVLAAIADALTSDDPWDVGAALMFYYRFPRAPGFDGVLALVTRDGAGRTYPCRYGPTNQFDMAPARLLAFRMATASRPPDGLDLQSVELLRTLVRLPGGAAGPNITEVLGELAGWDIEWLVAHADEIQRGTPGSWHNLLGALLMRGGPDAVERGGLAMVASGALDARELLKWARDRARSHRPYARALVAALKS